MSETHQFFLELKALAEDFQKLRDENAELKAKLLDLESAKLVKGIKVEAQLIDSIADHKKKNESLCRAGNEMARCILEAYEAGVISCATTRGVLASVVLKWQDIKKQTNDTP